LTTIVVVTTQVLALLLSVGPLAASGYLQPTFDGTEVSPGALLGSSMASFGAAIATWLSSILLSGMLTVVVGRAVFGGSITVGQAWRRLRPRFWALAGFTILLGLFGVLLGGIVFGLGYWIYLAAGVVPAFVIGVPLALAAVVAAVYVWTNLIPAPPIIVLEGLGIFAAVSRSFTLVRGDFWRVLGIWLLAYVVAMIIAGAVAIPFSFGGQILLTTATSTAMTMLAFLLITIGGAIAQIITAPFSAGVVVLQYTDRRIRAEAFDLTLQTGAADGPGAPADSTDHLWLTHHT
jgi:hypothetical protein